MGLGPGVNECGVDWGTDQNTNDSLDIDAEGERHGGTVVSSRGVSVFLVRV